MIKELELTIDKLNLQTQLYKNTLAGLKDDDVVKQFAPNTNHVAWLAGHLVSTRYMLANVLGINDSEPFPDIFAGGKGMQAGTKYPQASEMSRGWDEITEKIIGKLKTLSENEIKADAPQPVPTGKSVGAFINFITHHEAYTIGQLGLLRRLLGYPAMKYN